ncbi:phosphate acyltransferase PlsX [Bartonella sp. DGB1]|uniref:phosphate acyltransferase PlsX n=1 Tax=Bartonella sp. DGB1 TaxID=3239807 RepID=UPI003523F19F
MTRKITLAIDLMGGDHGEKITIAGAAAAIKIYPDIFYLFYGIEDKVKDILDSYPELKGKYKFFASETYISMNEKPAQAIRRGRNISSMWQAIMAVKEKKADACVSAGNTGVLMAMSKIILRMLANVDRPGIAGIWPTLTGQAIVLDIGASIGATDKHLVNLAIMGACMYNSLYVGETPKVGLLNIGVEEVKGIDEIKNAGMILQNKKWNNFEYIGFIEGSDIGTGKAQVVVTEGYSGNIALKTAEGTAKQISKILKNQIKSSFWNKIGYLFSYNIFRNLKMVLDPDRLNGGLLLGLNGIVVKSHGGTSAMGFCSAIVKTYKIVEHNLLLKIEQELLQVDNINIDNNINKESEQD